MSLPRYPDYKPSGIEWLGKVPAAWNVKRLRFAAQLNPSKNEVADEPRDSEVSFLPMETIGDDGSLNLERTRPIGEVETGYTYFREGDVTVAKITPCFENGKGAVMRGLVGGIGFGTTELTVVRPRLGQTSAEYLHYLFSSLPFRLLGEATMYGAGGQKRVPDDFFRNFSIAFPPLIEQVAITAFLGRETSKIDALVAEQERLIALLKEKRQAAISHAVTKGLNSGAPMKNSGIEWLGEVPAQWSAVPLKYLVSFQSGGTPSKENDEYWDGDVPWASAKDMKREVLGDTADHLTQYAIDEGAASLVQASSVVVVVRGMILARTFPVTLLSVPMAINQDLKALLPTESLDPGFLAWYLRGTESESLNRLDEAGHGTKALRMDAWSSLVIALPPRAEQKGITEFLNSSTERLDALVAEAQAAIGLLAERRSALISAAVTGQIDVRRRN
jgi:type I restriction enzyme S subunit